MNGYFDFNATTPLSAPAREAWLRANSSHWYNPSSLYREAGFTAQALDAARERLATLLGCEAGRLVFTSGATEANNALLAPQKGGVAISAVEHPSIREAAHRWLGPELVTALPVDAHGTVTTESLSKLSTNRPSLVSVMAANNESGVLQPWRELLAACHSHGIRFHTDATQWIGKLPAHELGACDYVSGSAHKFGGPKGCGFLMLRDEDEALRFLHGGPQENGRRAGTENYPAIEAMVTALEHATTLLADAADNQSEHRESFELRMQDEFPGLRIIGSGAPRLWNTSLMVMPAHSNLKWLTRLSRLGFAISTGSACSSGKEGSSVVVQALGASADELRRVVRISSGWETTGDDWMTLSDAFLTAAVELDKK